MVVYGLGGELIIRNGSALVCNRCPCGCKPRVIKSFTVAEADEHWCFDLRPYQGKGVGTPGCIWCRVSYYDPGDGLIWVHTDRYYRGHIDDDGVLVGLPPEICFIFPSLNPFSLQEGYYDENGNLILPDGCFDKSGEITYPIGCFDENGVLILPDCVRD